MRKLLGLCAVLAFVLSSVFAGTPAVALVGAKCGGFAGATCSKNEFCQRPTGICAFPDIEGTCVRVPHACPMVELPVCGCDGKTYGNDCMRERAKVSKAHDGKCF